MLNGGELIRPLTLDYGPNVRNHRTVDQEIEESFSLTLSFFLLNLTAAFLRSIIILLKTAISHSSSLLHIQ